MKSARYRSPRRDAGGFKVGALKGPAHWHFLALLPLPILAGWFLASQPAAAVFVDPRPMVLAQYAPAQVGASPPCGRAQPLASSAFTSAVRPSAPAP